MLDFSAWVLTREGVPQKIALFFSNVTDSPIVFLLIINVLLLIIGMFFDGSVAIIILAPLLTPIAVSLGIDPGTFRNGDDYEFSDWDVYTAFRCESFCRLSNREYSIGTNYKSDLTVFRNHDY